VESGLVMTPQERALLMIYTSVKDRLPVGADEFCEAVKDFDVIPLTESGKVFGGVLVKGNELHVGFAERPKSSIRRYIRSCLNDTIDKYGSAVTSVSKDNPRGLRFCERLGFVKIAEQNGNILLRCDRSDYD
jgi:hypothetical protein